MNQLLEKKMNQVSKKKKKGFTLVELIIVIAVIAVLAAIAIPKFGAIKSESNLRADQANAKIIATAVSSAVADGLTPDTGDVVDTENYISYIDGKKAPKLKSATGSFFVTYSSDDGTKVYIGSASGKQLYPASATATN